jgi:hypothetical protein
MKAIYSGCIPDPWLDVAIKLQQENNIEPVYWIGWDNYDKKINIKNEIKINFKQCIFHDLSIAWKAIFPEETNSIKKQSLDGELIDNIAPEELIAIKMMDRLDPDRKSFSFRERQRHFRLLLSKWLGIIDELKIELFVSPSIPHRVFDYALYVACKIKGVKTILYKLTPFQDVLVPISDIDFMPLEIENSYQLIKKKNANSELPEQIIESINVLQRSYEEAEPEYMKRQKETNKALPFRLFAKMIKKPLTIFKFYKLLNFTKNYHKVSQKNMEEVFLRHYQNIFFLFKGRKYKKNLKRYYENLCIDIDIEKESYVFVALHYQPEETTCPSAGHYVNQNLIVENLAETLPSDIKIVVKEHSSQFHPKMEGHTGRDENFYDDLLKIQQVCFVSSDVPSFKYIDNAISVATATGTIGWESIVRGKPVLIFGNSWYEYCDNVFRIYSKRDLKEALSVILSQDSVQADYLSYVRAVYSNSIVAYHYKGYDEKSAMKKEESVKNICSSIIAHSSN